MGRDDERSVPRQHGASIHGVAQLAGVSPRPASRVLMSSDPAEAGGLFEKVVSRREFKSGGRLGRLKLAAAEAMIWSLSPRSVRMS